MKYYNINEVLLTLNNYKYTSPLGFSIIRNDICNAVKIINKKHSKCGWVKFDEKHIVISLEGYYWIRDVYCAKNISRIDADVKFFEQLIEDYKKLCDEINLKYYIEPLIETDLTLDEISQLVNRKKKTVQNRYSFLSSEQKKHFYIVNGKKYIVTFIIEDLCKKYFKEFYLEYLEKEFLKLKEKLIKAGVDVDYE